MKNKLKRYVMLPVLGLAAAVSFTCCSDWTETESQGIQRPEFPQDNPELYARYIAALRSYKASNHQVLMAWFDNSEKQPVSRAHHPASVPDSVDIVSLLHPDELAAWEVDEINELQQKGTRVIFTFSYADMLAAYQATLPPAPDPEPDPEPGPDEELPAADEGGEVAPQPDGFLPYLTEQTDHYLSLVAKYGYDGVSVFYEPLPLLYLKPEDRVIEQARHEAFAAKLSAWTSAHSDKLFIFEGRPQNLIDKSLLQCCAYIVIRSFATQKQATLSSDIRLVMREGVPVDRFVVGVTARSLNPIEESTGRFTDSEGKFTLSAVSEAALWAAVPEAGFDKAGVAVYNVQTEYYDTNPTQIYKYVREAISTMNPSPKN